MTTDDWLQFSAKKGKIHYKCKIDLDRRCIDSEMFIYCHSKKGSRPLSIPTSVPHDYSEEFSVLDSVSPLFYAEELNGASFTEVYDLKLGYCLVDIIREEFGVNLEDTDGEIPKELIPLVPDAVRKQKHLIVSKIKEFIDYKEKLREIEVMKNAL